MFRKRRPTYTVKLQYDTGLKRGFEILGPDDQVAFKAQCKKSPFLIQVYDDHRQYRILEIPFNSARPGYEIKDPATDKLLGVVTRYTSPWILNFEKEEYVLTDAANRELLSTKQRNYIGLTIGPEKFRAYAGNLLVWTLRQSFFLSSAQLHMTDNFTSQFDQRLLLGMILILGFSTLKRISYSTESSDQSDLDMLFR